MRFTKILLVAVLLVTLVATAILPAQSSGCAGDCLRYCPTPITMACVNYCSGVCSSSSYLMSIEDDEIAPAVTEKMDKKKWRSDRRSRHKGGKRFPRCSKLCDKFCHRIKDEDKKAKCETVCEKLCSKRDDNNNKKRHPRRDHKNKRKHFKRKMNAVKFNDDAETLSTFCSYRKCMDGCRGSWYDCNAKCSPCTN